MDSSSNGIITDKPKPPLYLIICWNIVYWGIQVLAWLVIPICATYTYTGEFSFIRRVFAAALENIILYGAMAVAGVVVLGGYLLFIVIHNARNPTSKIYVTAEMILGVGQSLSNAYGLLLLVSFMGYGVVDLPRYLWQQANKERTMRLYEFEAARLEETRDEKEIALKEALSQVKSVDAAVPQSSVLRQYIDQIMKTCEKELNTFHHVRTHAISDQELSDMKRKHMVKLHKEVIAAINDRHRVEYQFKYLQDRAFIMQDIMKSMESSSKRIRSPFRRQRNATVAKLIDYPEWIFFKYFRHIVFRIAAVLMVFFGIIVVYSEFTPLFVTLLKKANRTSALRFISFYSVMIRALAPYRLVLQVCLLLMFIEWNVN
jgi:hypothetical protein